MLYDLLNDDDEDIRNEAAKIVSFILNHEKSDAISVSAAPQMAAAASASFRQYLAIHFSNVDLLFTNGIARLLGQSDAGTQPIEPITKIYARITKGSNDLFAAEKQNLYIDELAETVAWTTLLKSVSTRDAALVKALGLWADEGEAFLEEKIREQAKWEGYLLYYQNPDVGVLEERVESVRELLGQS